MKDININEIQFFTVVTLTAFLCMMLYVLINDSESAIFSLVIVFGGFLLHKTYDDLENIKVIKIF